MKTSQQGFTLIEMMIVTLIVATLAVIAIPAYNGFTIRAKIAEGINLANSAKTAVNETFVSTGGYAADHAGYGLPSASSISGNHTTSVSVDDTGTITIAFNNSGLGGLPSANGTNVVMTPTEVQPGQLLWDCTGGTTPNRYRPHTCRL